MLVVVTGTPGVGKTTVAWEAVHRSASSEAVLFVDLDGLGMSPLTPYQVLSALLEQMPGELPRAPSSVMDAARLWQSITEARPVVVVLDNAATEAQVRPVLGISGSNTVVVTSRRSLSGLEGAHRITLGPLQRDDSIAMLNELIPPAQRDPNAVAGLAAICEDIPLALRIAGNRLASRPAWQASEYLQRLRAEEDRLRLLVAGDLALEAAFSLSYDNLEPQTAHLFRAISIIDGGAFEVRTAAAASGLDWLEAESRLEDLTDLGLLEARGHNRYRMHDLLRLFALQCLRAQAGAAGIVQARNGLRAWLLNTLERAGAWFEPGRAVERPGDPSPFEDGTRAGEWIRSEAGHWWPAMQQAAALGDSAVVADVADALHWYSDVWVPWGHWTELFSLAVEASRRLNDPRLQATHLGYLSWAINVERGDYLAAREIGEQALAAATAAGDYEQRGWANFYIAWACRKAGDLDAATAAIRESVEAFTETDEDDGLAIAISSLARVLDLQGLHDESIAELNAILARLQSDHSQNKTVSRHVAEYCVHLRLADSYLAKAWAQEAIDAATQALDISVSLDDKARITSSLTRRIRAHVAAGHSAEAEADIAYALGVLGPKQAEAHVLEELRSELS